MENSSMALPISNDLRERIIRFYENHDDYTQSEIADEFGVSRSFFRKALAPLADEPKQCGFAPGWREPFSTQATRSDAPTVSCRTARRDPR
jgi:Bacterial regulatory proteins, gntR family